MSILHTCLTVGEFPVKVIVRLPLVTQERGEGLEILKLNGSVDWESLGEHVLGVEPTHVAR